MPVRAVLAQREWMRDADEASDAGDEATADIFTEVCRGIDKFVRMVEAHLQADPPIDARRADRSEQDERPHVQ